MHSLQIILVVNESNERFSRDIAAARLHTAMPARKQMRRCRHLQSQLDPRPCMPTYEMQKSDEKNWSELPRPILSAWRGFFANIVRRRFFLRREQDDSSNSKIRSHGDVITTIRQNGKHIDRQGTAVRWRKTTCRW